MIFRKRDQAAAFYCTPDNEKNRWVMNTEKLERRAELLAPGGSFEGMKAAVNAGADAVYMGGTKFGARAYAQNPDEEGLLEAIDYCHLHGRKLYMTVNTLLKEEELETQLYPYLKPYYERGLDAVLVQDLGALSFLKEMFPGLALHASTQMSVQSVQGAKLAQQLGFERVVPARELSLEEIRRIYEATGMEIECFIHGALCYSYSGQCLLSSLIGGRSGNRGRCAQPCRQAYELEDDAGKRLSRKEAPYLLSLKDICTVDLLPELMDAGVCSFKIEGRMKRPEYAAGVVSIYRYYLDRILEGRPAAQADEQDLTKLMDLYNRGGFSKGYYFVEHSAKMMSMQRPNHAGTPAIKVLSGGAAPLCLALEDLKEGDHIEVEAAFANKGKEIRGREEAADKAWEIRLREDHPAGTKFRLSAGSLPAKAREGSIYARVQSRSLLDDLKMRYLDGTLKEKINGKFILRPDEPAILEVSFGQASAQAEGDVPQPALARQTEAEDIRKQLEKTGDTPFFFGDLQIDAAKGCFFPLGQINRMRRSALEQLEKNYLNRFRRNEASGNEPDVSQNAGPQNVDFRFTGYKCAESGNAEARLAEPRSAEPRNAGLRNAGVGKIPELRAFVETKEQQTAVLKSAVITRVYLDSMRYLDMAGTSQDIQAASKAAMADLKAVQASGKECFLAFPPIWRARARDIFMRIFQKEQLSRFDGLLIRVMDQIPDASSLEIPVVSDSGLYCWNRRAAASLHALGAAEQVLPAELNGRELSAIGRLDSELVIYGYTQVMTCAQCLMADTAGCTRKPSLLMLKDRMNMRFPVRTHCSICTNVIYNSLPLRIFDEWEKCRETGAGAFCLRFSIEDAKQTERILQQLQENLFDGAGPAGEKKAGSLAGEQFTRGHFRRGVE